MQGHVGSSSQRSDYLVLTSAANAATADINGSSICGAGFWPGVRRTLGHSSAACLRKSRSLSGTDELTLGNMKLLSDLHHQALLAAQPPQTDGLRMLQQGGSRNGGSGSYGRSGAGRGSGGGDVEVRASSASPFINPLGQGQLQPAGHALLPDGVRPVAQPLAAWQPRVEVTASPFINPLGQGQLQPLAAWQPRVDVTAGRAAAATAAGYPAATAQQPTTTAPAAVDSALFLPRRAGAGGADVQDPAGIYIDGLYLSVSSGPGRVQGLVGLRASWVQGSGSSSA